MEYETLRFGTVVVRDDEVIYMPEGPLGFAHLKRFAILNLDQYYPFRWMQSLENRALAFGIIDPTLFRPNYRIKISQSEIESLELENPQDAVVIVIVTLNSDPSLITANLQGPIILNHKNRRAKQIVLADSQYSTKHYILQERNKFTGIKTSENNDLLFVGGASPTAFQLNIHDPAGHHQG